MSDLKHLLKDSRLFGPLEDPMLQEIADRFQPAQYKKDDMICAEGEMGDQMFLLAKGTVAIQKNKGWGARELKQMGPGEIFGEMALISQEPRSASVIATADVRCHTLNGPDFQHLLEKHPMFAQQVLKTLVSRLQNSDEQASRQLIDAQRALIFSLAQLADSRDPETGAHLQRTRQYCVTLAETLKKANLYSDAITETFIESLYYLSPLHDIGKVAVPDAILLKPGRLTEEEYSIMQTHAAEGAKTLQTVMQHTNQPIFHIAHNLCKHHHERWDGTGYPDGLKEEQIPLEARIMALADVYDALLSKRVYKPPMEYAKAHHILQQGAGTQFDPILTEIMLQNSKAFDAIHRQLADPD